MVEKKFTQGKYFYSTVVIALTVVVTIALFFLVISPFFSKAQSLTADAKVKQEELDKLEAKKAKLDELKSREEELKANAEKVRNALPEEKDVGRLFIEFDNMAKATGGTIKVVSEGGGSTGSAPGQTSSSDIGSTGIQKITYTIPVTFKDYFGLKDFVNRTETALRLLKINGYQITVNDTGVTGNFTADSFVRSTP